MNAAALPGFAGAAAWWAARWVSIAVLLAARKLKTKGQKRGTKYFTK